MIATARAVLAASLTLTAAPLAAAAVTADTKAEHLCGFPAYLIDKDRAGTNIRAAPSTGAPVIGRLPPLKKGFGAEFRVIGSTGGWFLILNAAWQDYEGIKPGPLFAGPGWVAASLVGFETEDRRLWKAPAMNAPLVLTFGPGDPIVKRAYGCSGSFVDVDVESPDQQKMRGWVTQICANQQTTCGGGLQILEEHDGKLVPPE